MTKGTGLLLQFFEVCSSLMVASFQVSDLIVRLRRIEEKNKEGQIYLNTQSWAILSQVAPELRAKKCLKAIQDKLDTKFGPVLFAPPYSKYDPEIGRIISFAAGTKENAAIFSHACA